MPRAAAVTFNHGSSTGAPRRRRGEAEAKGRTERGHVLLIVLVTVMIMIVGTTVAMQVWSTVVKRDREEELIFRGKQYAVALNLYRQQRGILPTELKQLEEKGPAMSYVLRRPWKDPMTGEAFGIVMMGPNGTPIPDEPIDENGPAPPAFPTGRRPQPPQASMGQLSGALSGTPAAGGMQIMGVHSKSRDYAQGPALWHNLERYNQWLFLITDVGGQIGVPGQPGQPGQPGVPTQPGVRSRGAIPGPSRPRHPDEE